VRDYRFFVYIYMVFRKFQILHYSDEYSAAGKGDVDTAQKNIPLQSNSNYPQLITTARYQNNRDAWIITMDRRTRGIPSALSITLKLVASLVLFRLMLSG
jgi:hypothetical protein